MGLGFSVSKSVAHLLINQLTNSANSLLFWFFCGGLFCSAVRSLHIWYRSSTMRCYYFGRGAGGCAFCPSIMET